MAKLTKGGTSWQYRTEAKAAIRNGKRYAKGSEYRKLWAKEAKRQLATSRKVASNNLTRRKNQGLI